MAEWERDTLAMIVAQENAYIAPVKCISPLASVAVPTLKCKKAMAHVWPNSTDKATAAAKVAVVLSSLSSDDDTDTATEE